MDATTRRDFLLLSTALSAQSLCAAWRRNRARCRRGRSRRRAKRCRSSALGSTRPVTAIAERGPAPVEAVIRTLVEHGGRVVDTWPRSDANDGAFGADHQRARSARPALRHDQSRAARRAGGPRALRAHAAPLSARVDRSPERRQPHRPRRAVAEPATLRKTPAARATSASRPRKPRSTPQLEAFLERERPDFVEINYSVTERDAEPAAADASRIAASPC